MASYRHFIYQELPAIGSFIHRAAFGTTLISQQERVQRAMNKVYTRQTWTALQKRWLGRIERQLLAETVLLQAEDLDQKPFSQHSGIRKRETQINNEITYIVSNLNGELFTSA